MAVEAQLFADLRRERRNIDLGLQEYSTLHERRSLHGKLQQVTQITIWHRHFELHSPVLMAFVLNDSTAGPEIRRTEFGDHRLQDCVAVRAVHLRLEPGIQRYLIT